MNTYLRDTIIESAKIDQEARFLDNIDPTIKKLLIYSIDAAHSHKIRMWVEEFGYPTKELVGEEALHQFWLLVQHQDLDLPLMERCLANCQFSPEDEAFLTDRVCKVKGLPQIYGTQFHRVNGDLVTYPIQYEETVDARRAEMGLEPLSEYVSKQD